MFETKSVLAVRSTSFLFGVDECLEIVDVAVSICKMFSWELSTPVSRGCFKEVVTQIEDSYLKTQFLVTYCCSINLKGNHSFKENVEKAVECQYFGDVV